MCIGTTSPLSSTPTVPFPFGTKLLVLHKHVKEQKWPSFNVHIYKNVASFPAEKMSPKKLNDDITVLVVTFSAPGPGVA